MLWVVNVDVIVELVRLCFEVGVLLCCLVFFYFVLMGEIFMFGLLNGIEESEMLIFYEELVWFV